MNDEFNDFFEDEDEDGFDESDFDEIDEELDILEVRTAILSKNEMIALLCMKTAIDGGAICRVDPREKRPTVQVYDDPKKAEEWFNRSLRTSRANGWHIVYDGLPLEG
jgi:hypothetical protein